MAGKYLLTTLGCKVNQYESQQIREVLESFGLRPALSGEPPAVAVVNTCAVTATAMRKNRQTIHRLARNGRTPVVVIGCGVSAESDRLRLLEGVTAVLGHDADVCAELRDILVDRLEADPTESRGLNQEKAEETHKHPDVAGNDVFMKPAVAQHRQDAPTSRTSNHSTYIIPRRTALVKQTGELTDRIDSFAGHQRAFLKVQDGCDAYCTYCIIPRLRPGLRSKPVDIAVAEARALVRAGHREIILTGIFLGAYGRETALRKRWPDGRSPLADLVDALARVEGLDRLRLSSLEPGDVDASLLNVLADHETCVPHLHLPLQSGSQTILTRMNRQYDRDAFVAMIDRVREALDRPAISTDLIVGFPGETDADFEASLTVARHARFSKIHAFPFSPREQTAAARWQREFVPGPVVRERMKRVAALERELSLDFRRQFLGATERVVVEQSEKTMAGWHGQAVACPCPSPDEHGQTSLPMPPGAAEDRTQVEEIPAAPPSILHGRSDRYFEIHFEAGTAQPAPAAGGLVTVRIDRVTPARTHGTLTQPQLGAYPLPVLTAG